MSRRICQEVDHCSLAMWDIEHALDEAERELASTSTGLHRSVNMRTVAALRRLRSEWLAELRAVDEDIRAAVREVRCERPADGHCMKQSAEVMERRAAARHRPPYLEDALGR